ncbi:MAG TPA: PAS domain-containing protein, partial [Polyangiaceae bacterium]|nr:PAS domain-containing protein [Polyangiaceae bacterium]
MTDASALAGLDPDPFEDAPCGLARTSGTGIFLAVNRTWCGWLGYSAHELIGKLRLQDLLTMGGRIF